MYFDELFLLNIESSSLLECYTSNKVSHVIAFKHVLTLHNVPMNYVRLLCRAICVCCQVTPSGTALIQVVMRDTRIVKTFVQPVKRIRALFSQVRAVDARTIIESQNGNLSLTITCNHCDGTMHHNNSCTIKAKTYILLSANY